MKRVGVLLTWPVLLGLACGGLAQPTADLPATVQVLQATLTAQAAATRPPATAGPTFTAPTPDPSLPAFYVATDGSDETGDGSANAPWATITHALDSVADGSLILVRPGLYTGRVRIRGQFAAGVTVRSEVPYRAQLRADETVLTIFEAQGITIAGFDIAHLSPAAGPIVVQIQDALGDAPGGDEFTSRITLRDNLIHDAYDNDLLKINNGAQHITVTGNVFYNQGDSDEHIDINSVRDVVVEDNIFFNAYAASGRPVTGESSSFIVAKDSNGDEDGLIGLSGLIIRRNVFLHYEGSPGANMILLGEDGAPYYEADNVLIENNLFLGDGAEIRAPFGTKGAHNVVFRHNTITGDMPGRAFAWRSNVEGENQPNDNIQLYNNIWSDPTGTMTNFATAPQGETAVFTLNHNLYWNGGQPLPQNGEDMIQISADAAALTGDPRLPPPVNVPLPVWDAAAGVFGGGASDIRAAFLQLVLAYGVPPAGSAALDQADPAQTSGEDILGQARTGAPDLGAYEVQGNEQVVVLATSAPAATPPGGGGGEPPAGDSPQPTLPLPSLSGWVIFTRRLDDHDCLYRLPLLPNAAPEDLTARLDGLAPGAEADWGALSADGAWFLLATDRFDPDCVGWPCLVLTPDFVNFEVVRSARQVVHAQYSAVAAGGGLIVYQNGGGTHDRDLYAIRREAEGWSASVELTTASPFGQHLHPSLSPDGARVVFACSDDPYAGAALCEAATDGSAFSVRLAAGALGEGATVFFPSYAPDGSIVFESERDAQQLWRLAAGSDQPQLVSALDNDGSPCVLPDGTLVSLWNGRPGGTGAREIKLMAVDGRQYAMLLTGVDVFAVGLGCGGTP
ncbi:MAG: hypothetical protein IT317_10965 [Anaerolineales bacterium]|nr:hypothetical protein [Anaerolineales bacterium]